MPKVAEKKNFLKKPYQGPLGASNPVLYQREGVGLPCVSFKNQSTGQGSEDRSEPSPRFSSNGIHTKNVANNLQGNGFGRSPDASQVLTRRGSQNPVSKRSS